MVKAQAQNWRFQAEPGSLQRGRDLNEGMVSVSSGGCIELPVESKGHLTEYAGDCGRDLNKGVYSCLYEIMHSPLLSGFVNKHLFSYESMCVGVSSWGIYMHVSTYFYI